MKDMKYSDKIHLVGRAGSVMSLCIMLGIPALICAVYDIWPTIGEVVSIGSGLLAIFVPTAISEVFSYTPILGSACYIAFITGNVLNLKLPCAVSAMELADVAQGSEEGDAISTVAIAASSMLTMVVIALGVVLLVPLQPILQQPAVQTATTYMLPALFGSMFFGMITSKSAGEYIIHGKLKAVVLPLIVIVLVNFFVTPISGKEGYAMLGAIPLTILCAYVLYKKGAIKVELAKGWFEGQGMREITSTDINRELMHMAAQGYAYKSIAGQKSVLSLIWQYWCAEMHGDANPCTLLKLPQGLPQTKRRAPTEREVADVKAHPEGFGLCPAIMMYAGLRLGEVMALQKKDLADGAIRVRKAVVWHNNYPELEEPKTDSAYRTVPILKPLQDALGSRLADLADDDFIFGGKKPMTKSRYQNAWLQYCISIGHAHDSGKRYKTGKTSVTGEALYKAVLEADFTAHQLRHEFASVLVECQISPQVAKELMGHADILTTQRWYAEAKASAVDEATRILNAHFTA